MISSSQSMRIPDTLAELYPEGTSLSEVHPDFRGMPLKRWRKLKDREQCEAWLATLDQKKVGAPINRKAVATKRDSYGMKGM
jgi:hypothetical protein